ncbi:hypothetical protein SAMN03097699_2953 [Flavobacteriaceae bacterium MAR_2010_188]|nr:hypothetical protein SAMN03097699_2953 [Flavobacteriaceae bacterium MAR_2010_188]
MFLEKYKALIITVLFTGIIILGLFSFHLTEQSKSVAESYYEIEPQTLEEILEKEKILQELSENMPSTNQAVNEDDEFKEMMKNFKTMNSNDLERTQEADEEQSEETEEAEEILMSDASNPAMSSGTGVDKDEFKKYDKVKDILAMRSPEKREKPKNLNANSTLTYSLKGRDMLDFDTPRYLCEESGKIVVNITVNSVGEVTETYINSSSTSDNECLTGAAIEYAESVTFSSSANASQLGSITFYFKGKN